MKIKKDIDEKYKQKVVKTYDKRQNVYCDSKYAKKIKDLH